MKNKELISLSTLKESEHTHCRHCDGCGYVRIGRYAKMCVYCDGLGMVKKRGGVKL